MLIVPAKLNPPGIFEAMQTAATTLNENAMTLIGCMVRDELAMRSSWQDGLQAAAVQGLLCGAVLGVNVRIGCPEGFEPLPGVLEQARSLAQQGAQIDVMADPSEAVRGAQAVYTDVWASMGQEQEQAERERAFAGFSVDRTLMDQAAPDAIVLHCLPAHRGEEISAEVMHED